MFMGVLHHRMHKLNSGLGNSNAVDTTDEEMCNTVRDLVYSDRRIQVEEIANASHISHGSVSTTLNDRLGMHKLTARWVPKSLSDEQTATRASSIQCIVEAV